MPLQDCCRNWRSEFSRDKDRLSRGSPSGSDYATWVNLAVIKGQKVLLKYLSEQKIHPCPVNNRQEKGGGRGGRVKEKGGRQAGRPLLRSGLGWPEAERMGASSTVFWGFAGNLQGTFNLQHPSFHPTPLMIFSLYA